MLHCFFFGWHRWHRKRKCEAGNFDGAKRRRFFSNERFLKRNRKWWTNRSIWHWSRQKKEIMVKTPKLTDWSPLEANNACFSVFFSILAQIIAKIDFFDIFFYFFVKLSKFSIFFQFTKLNGMLLGTWGSKLVFQKFRIASGSVRNFCCFRMVKTRQISSKNWLFLQHSHCRCSSARGGGQKIFLGQTSTKALRKQK